MIRFFKKQRLAARGLSCGKTRLATSEREMIAGLEGSIFLRIGIVLMVGALLALICFSGDPVEPWKHLIYALLILAMAVIQPVISGNSALKCNSRLGLFLGLT